MSLVSWLGIGGSGATNEYQPSEANLNQTNYTPAIAGAIDASTNAVNNTNSAEDRAMNQKYMEGLQNRIAGNAPSVAENQLMQSLGQNQADTASTISSMKGINPGLQAQLIAGQQGRNASEIGGQAATLRAQEQAAAESNLGQAISGQQGQDINNEIGGYNASTNRINTLGGLQGQNNQQTITNHEINQNLSAQIAAQNAGQLMKGASGLSGGGSGAASAVGMMMAKGGKVQKFGTGGTVTPSNVSRFLTDDPNPNQAGTSKKKPDDSLQTTPNAADTGPGATDLGANYTGTMNAARGGKVKKQPKSSVGQFLAKGGSVKAMLSPGEKYLSPKEAKAVAQGKADPMKAGKTVPGKAKVKGDSLKNDTVPATLKAGGVVIPRHVTQSKEAAEKARKFVQAIMSKQSLKRAKK